MRAISSSISFIRSRIPYSRKARQPGARRKRSWESERAMVAPGATTRARRRPAVRSRGAQLGRLSHCSLPCRLWSGGCKDNRTGLPAKKLLARRVSACHTRLLPRHLLRGVRQLDVRGSSVPVSSRAPCLTSTFSGWTGAATWCALTPLFACASAAGFRVCAQLRARVTLRNSCANRSASATRIRRLSTKSSSWTRSGARVRWRTAL